MNDNSKHPCSPQSILVVDDELQVREILEDSLGSHGHRVDTANDGLDAIEKVKTGTYNIIVTDMDMPRMDGMQLIKHIVQNYPGTDIIAITGHVMKYKYTEVVSAGAADFITKPFTLDELEAKLNRVVRERGLREELQKLAIHDHLTGLANRRSFQDTVRKEAIRAVRYQHPLFMFFLDIDRFKDYNDLYGHQAGDGLLVQLAKLLENSIREEVDSAFRYGGDEFVLLLPYLPADQVFGVAKRIRGKYGRLEFAPTSLSIGIARFVEDSANIDEDILDMIRRSDQALYDAKKSQGKNAIFIDCASR